ncbi:heparinase II/III domain-containing protein [Paenibacillus nasutitermitis]|uniref:Heparinase II/III-like C-terminal domain-containing protein n=1 Tax=Paenibacillus nasutitermitis TaxID=1652958 RepID=A0A916Z9K2_9BACL|nr:heparinase II/III family protein [Paenibacillus nasutitermitis]GGD81388.1 hypothetical protein GCM10010911_44410 [Paenibacillus nasutitermitis]
MGIDQLTLRELKTALEEAEREGFTLFPESLSADNWKKSAENPLFASLWREVREKGSDYASRPIEVLPFSEFILFGSTGDRQIFEAKIFERRKRLSVLALLRLTDAPGEWDAPLADCLWAMCEESTWVFPAHVGLYRNAYPEDIWDRETAPRESVDLFAAITGFALAELSAMLGDSLHPWIRERIRKELDARIFGPFFRDPAPQNWEMKTNNWPAVCAAGIGAAAIYEERDSERLSGMLWRIIEAMRNHLAGFDEEGATAEGVAYWQFGFGFYVYFSELLKERTGGRIDLLEGDKIGKIVRFPNACLLSESKVVNFSDSVERVDFNLGLFARLQARFGDIAVPQQKPEVNQLFTYWANTSRLMMWTLREAAEKSEPAASGIERAASTAGGSSPVHEDYYFKGHQWAISKSRYGEAFIAFAAKGGNNGEPHNHNDLGHFLLHMNGDTVLADPGAGFYTRQYFQPDFRYETLTAGSHGHSVPIIGGRRQSAGKEYQAKVIHYSRSDDEVVFELDLAGAYNCPGLKELTRRFRWERYEDGKLELIVTDSAGFEGQPQSLVEVFISAVEPVQTEAGTLKLGPVDMFYAADAFELEIDPQIVTGISGEGRMFYRVLLSASSPALRMESEVRFKWRV